MSEGRDGGPEIPNMPPTGQEQSSFDHTLGLSDAKKLQENQPSHQYQGVHPEARHDMPEINMLMDDEALRQSQERRFLEQDYETYLATGKSAKDEFLLFVNNLKRSEKAIPTVRDLTDKDSTPEDIKKAEVYIKKERERQKEAKESLPEVYERAVDFTLNVIKWEVFEGAVDSKKNANPFDARLTEDMVSTLREYSYVLSREGGLESREAKLWAKRMERDAAWLEGFKNVTLAQTASLPGYYDVGIQMQTLKDRYRKYATAEQFVKMFGNKVPGLDFDEGETQEIRRNGVGMKIESKYQSVSAGDEREKEKTEIPLPLVEKGEFVGLRELAIKMQDSSMEARMKLAAVSQMDLSKDTHKERMATSYMDETELSEVEAKFYLELFMEWDEKGNGMVETPYVTDREDKLEKVTSYLEAILLTNAVERLKQIARPGATNVEEELGKLINDVRKEGDRRVQNWYARSREAVSNLAEIITRQGYLQDYAFMHAYDYCWAFQFKRDKGAPFTDAKTIKGAIARSGVETSSIYTWGGDIPSLYWKKRRHNYDKMGNSSTNLLLPTHRKGRKEALSRPWVDFPKFKFVTNNGNEIVEQLDHPDEFLVEMWSNVFGPDDSWRRSVGYKDGYKPIPEKIKKKLASWATPWSTPYLTNYLVEGQEDKLGTKIDIPFFMPEGCAGANFFDMKKPADPVTGRTIWEQLKKGDKKLSGMEWNKTMVHQLDRILVDHEMAWRFMRLLIENYDSKKDPFFELVTGNVSTMGPKELAKRVRLALRDGPDSTPTEYDIAFIPMFIVLATHHKYGLEGVAAWKYRSQELNDFPVASGQARDGWC